MELIFILAVLLGTNHELNEANVAITNLEGEVITQAIEIDQLAAELDQVESVAIKTATAHSAFYANQNVRTDILEEQLEGLAKIVIKDKQ